MEKEIDSIRKQALEQINQAVTLEDLENIRISILGKKGQLSEVLKNLGKLQASDRPLMGQIANECKKVVEIALTQKFSEFEEKIIQEQLDKDKIDITAPSRQMHQGSLHLITQTTQKIIDVFKRVGFDLTLGPEVETEFLNFEAVNIPVTHPARDMQDTFFFGPGVVLRTHTSPVQIRSMMSQKWPIRILCPGAVYRCDQDATHSPMFHQIEGLWIDENVKMSHLKGVLEYWAKEMFGSDTKIRLRPSYFPFVEPGAEVDVSCFQCKIKLSSDCRVCKGTGWSEILGAGMVHPKLLENVGYNENSDKKLTGFAFGMGVERIAMRLSETPDLRFFYQGDIRFLKQY